MSQTGAAGHGTRLLAAVVLSACVGLVGGGLGAWGVYTHFGPSQRVITQVNTGGGTVSAGDIAAAVQPSLMTISTQPTAANSLATGNTAGLAQGFAVSPGGLVLTAAQAVRGATRLRVAGPDGHGYDATIAATDLPDGLVLLRAAGATSLQPLRFAAQAPHIGDVAIVVSDAALSSLNARNGAVAALGLTASDGTSSVNDLLSIDATPAVGSLGAPVVDASGAVIGVVTEVASVPGVICASGRDGAALVAAAPGGTPAAHATFGVTTALVGAATAAATGLPEGALVQSVDAAGPAAGLLAVGDVVTAVDGTPVTASPMQPSTFDLQAGQKASLSVTGADGGSRTVSMVVGTG